MPRRRAWASPCGSAGWFGFGLAFVPVRSITPVEAAVAVAIAGSVLATALPAFVRNLHASELVEPIDGLNRIASRASAQSASRPVLTAYPPSVPLTPAVVPAGARAEDPPGTWDHPSWRMLDFAFETPHSYAFAFDSRNGSDVSTFVARAHGDLDGDGSLSEFLISGEIRAGGTPTVGTLEMSREIE